MEIGDVVDITIKAKITKLGLKTNGCPRTDHIGVNILYDDGREIPLRGLSVHPEKCKVLKESEIKGV